MKTFIRALWLQCKHIFNEATGLSSETFLHGFYFVWLLINTIGLILLSPFAIVGGAFFIVFLKEKSDKKRDEAAADAHMPVPIPREATREDILNIPLPKEDVHIRNHMYGPNAVTSFGCITIPTKGKKS